MYKALVLLKRADDLSLDEFKEWFLGAHARHAIKIAGQRAKRYTASFVIDEAPRSPWGGDEPPYDVISELWCDDLETLHSLYADLAGKHGEVGDVLVHSSVRIAFVTDEHDLLARHQDVTDTAQRAFSQSTFGDA